MKKFPPFLQILWQKLAKTLNVIAILLIQLYRLIFSPSVGVLRFLSFYPKNVCIFHPTCSEYGLIVFRTYPFHTAFLMTLDRVRRCHPGNEPRVDYPHR